MSKEGSEDESTDSGRPPAKKAIVAHLLVHGRSTVHEIATGTGFSNNWTRIVAKDHRSEGIIKGTKTTPIIGCNVRGTTIVLTSSRDAMLQRLGKAAPEHLPHARTLSVSDLHDFIKQIADSYGLFSRRWEFWIDEEDSHQVKAAKELAGDVYVKMAEEADMETDIDVTAVAKADD